MVELALPPAVAVVAQVEQPMVTILAQVVLVEQGELRCTHGK
tara:strand:- start:203 stop:328 length:126 start_codon:yes stop_codon:yes gene_type:complete